MQPISLKQAIKQGLTRYWTGKPCKYGHIAERMTSDRTCLECHRLRSARCRPNNLEYHRLYIQRWRIDNPELNRQYQRANYHRNKTERNAYSRDYGRRNRQRLAELNRLWFKANPKKIVEYANKPKRKIENLLRVRLRTAVKRRQKAGSAVRDLGCSIQQFREYIEAQFTSNMSWENHGKLWQIDHIRCLGLFDLTNREQFQRACHFSNFQPLLKSDHKLKTISDHEMIRKLRTST